jgi:hypothetical protein
MTKASDLAFEAKWFTRGFLGLRPIPYHSAGRAWSRGGACAAVLLALALLALFLAAPFFIGRWTA